MSRNNDTICCSEKLGYEGPSLAVQYREFFSVHSNLDFVDLASMEGEHQVFDGTNARTVGISQGRAE
jgi:hypothetical protein